MVSLWLRLHRLVSRLRSLRSEWNARTVAAYVDADREVMEDQPRLRSVIEQDLTEKIERAQWQFHARDAWWHARAAWLTLRGQHPGPYPWHDEVTVQVRDNVEDWFERGRRTVTFLAEKRRMPRRAS